MNFEYIPFKPMLGLKSAYLQTILGSRIGIRTFSNLKDEKLLSVQLDDGDKLILVINKPAVVDENTKIIFMMHGLTGSSNSGYMSRIASKLLDRNYIVIRMNHRGCGQGFGLAKNPYHSGRVEDLSAALNAVKSLYPNLAINIAGFSLSGNIVLKYAATISNNHTNVESVIAVCPPSDLIACKESLYKKSNLMFNKYFTQELIKHVYSNHQELKLSPYEFPKNILLYDFDNLYTAPNSGFKDANEYYLKSSSKHDIEGITIPTLIVQSNDDPIVPSCYLKERSYPKNIKVVRTNQGGHLGFLACKRLPSDYRWLDYIILKWLDNLEPAYADPRLSVEQHLG